MALLGNLTGSSQYFNDRVFYNGVATQSLRFDDGSSAYLTRTPSGAGNRTTWTWSGWVKLGVVTIDRTLFGAGTNGDNQTFINLGDTDKLVFNNEISNSRFIIQTDAVFRDVSAWYHVVLAVDTTQSTDTNRVKIYVNGELQTLSSVLNGYPNQNVDTFVNATNEHEIGSSSWGPEYYNDGYMAEVNFVDGTQLTPSSFGETKNGVWIPIKYTGSYGTNGFRLQFDQTGVGTASTSTIGADTSGNTHHFTSSGIVASDCNMPDSPENNFATFNGLITTNSGSLSEGNLKSNSVVGGGSKYGTNGSTFLLKSGKWYAEMLMIGGSSIGATFSGAVTYRNDSSTRIGFDIAIVYTTVIYSNGGVVQSGLSGISAGDVFGFAVDVDNKTCQVYKNGSTYGSQIDWSGNTYADNGFSGLGHGHGSSLSNSTIAVNYGQDSSFAGNKTSGSENAQDANEIGDFYDTVPSGFLALCSANLPEPTISPNETTQADDHFNTILYTGNGSPAEHPIGFRPNLVWGKRRNIGNQNHWWINDVTDIDAFMSSDNIGDEGSEANGTTFNANGSFTTANNDLFVNNGSNYVVWAWKGNGTGTATSNTSGSINSTVSVNTKAGLSIVSYTGTGANATVGHGIGIAPRMIIMKRRDADQNWVVYHEEIGNDRELLLNVGNQQTNSSSTFFQNTSPTTSVFSLGSDNYANASSGTYVAYCFADVEGYSKIGKYNPNNTTDSAFVYTGFKPAMVIVKGAEINNQEWCILDNKRPSYNPVYNLNPNEPAIETTSNYVDFVSNGFKIRATGGVGYLTSKYIYIAFAEVPFKYANGG